MTRFTTLLVLLGLCAGAVLPAAAAVSVDSGVRVDINRATSVELEAIPGIGKTMAERIVAFRDEHGPFRRVEDLLKIKGIGEKSFAKLKPHVTISKKRS